MCWRGKQIPISFRTPSLTQLIPEAPEGRGGGGHVCSPWALPSSAYFLALLSRLSRSLKALVQGMRGGNTEKGCPLPQSPLLNHTYFG